MEHKTDIGFQVGVLDRMIRHAVDQAISTAQTEQVTGVQGWIIGYLYGNRDKDVFQRDLQSHFSVQRSTVTGMLKLMERDGLIVRRSVDWDARLKKLELTPKAMKMHEAVMRGFRQAEERVSATLTAEEKETFLRLCEKIRSGLEDPACAEKQ